MNRFRARFALRPLGGPAFATLAIVATAQSATAGGYPYPVAIERTPAPAPLLERRVTTSPQVLEAMAPAAPTIESATPRDELAAQSTPVAPAAAAVAGPIVRTEGAAPLARAVGGRAAAGAFEADRSVSLRISDDVGVLTYERDATRLGVDNARVQAAFLLSEQRDNIFTGTLLLDTRPDLVPGFRISAGTRAYAALLGAENRDVFALGLGVSAGYTLPVKVLPLELDANAFFAPDVLAFGQADRIIDWNVDVGLRLRERLAAFAGVRFLQVDTRPGSREVDDELHIGVRWTLAAPAESRPIVFD